MRKLLSIATLVVVGLLAPVVAHPTPADAAVPGLSFTSTGCDSHSDAVVRLYAAAFDRQPERSGFNYWFDAYTDGRHTLPSMAEFFVASPELAATYGDLNDVEFIDRIYLNVLGRPADFGGKEFWLEELNSGATRATILLRFSESPENVANSGTAEPALGYYNSGLQGAWECEGLTECGVASAPPLAAGDCSYPDNFVATAIRNQSIEHLVYVPAFVGETFDRTELDAMVVDVQTMRDDVDYVVPGGIINLDADGNEFVDRDMECDTFGYECVYVLVGHCGHPVAYVKVSVAEFGIDGFAYHDGPIPAIECLVS